MKHLIFLALLLAAPIGAQQTPQQQPAAAPQVSPAIDTAKIVPVKQHCAAITKKGLRCKRYAHSGSLYCTQHQNYQPPK